jgi:hypothetical protein
MISRRNATNSHRRIAAPPELITLALKDLILTHERKAAKNLSRLANLQPELETMAFLLECAIGFCRGLSLKRCVYGEGIAA